MPLKRTVFRTSYTAGKSLACGLPLGVVCVKAIKQCIKDVATEDMPSIACKAVLHYCVPATAVVSCLGAYGTPETAKKMKVVAKIVVNFAGIIFTGPSYLADMSLAGVETFVFGEPIPIGSNSLFLLD